MRKGTNGQRPYGWRQQLIVGLAILAFVAGAPWTALELSRWPLIARAAEIGERICRRAVEGRLGGPEAGVKVAGLALLGPGTSGRLRGMAPALGERCFYSVREGDLMWSEGATHILTIANYPAGDARFTDFDATMTALSLRIHNHLIWSPIYDALAVALGGTMSWPGFGNVGYISGDAQFERAYPETAPVFRRRGVVAKP